MKKRLSLSFAAVLLIGLVALTGGFQTQHIFPALDTDNIWTGANSFNGVVTVAGPGNTFKNSSFVGASNGNVMSLLNSQGNAGAITGTSSPVTVYTYTLPANTIATAKGIRVNCAMLHTGAAAVTYALTVNGVTIFSIATADGAPVANETMLATGATTAGGAGWITKVLSGTLTGGSVNTISGLNWAANQTVTITFNVANTDSVTPIYFLVEAVQ